MTRTAGKKDALTRMSALKASTLRRWETLWERLQRRDRWPRRWWYPPRPQVTQKQASKTAQKNYEECVATVRRTMLAILGFGLFTIVVTFGTPDTSLIASQAKVKLPFAESEIEFLGFLAAVPFLLVVLTIYLHIFDTSRRELESAYKVSPTPTLFTLNRPLPNLLTSIVFYWLVPIVLAALTWKALARLEWGLPLLAVTIAVTGALVWILIRRRPADERLRKNLPLWVFLIGLTSVACFAAWEAYTGLVGPQAWHQDAFRRGLNLFRADLAGKWLVRADLRGANLRFASLVGAKLNLANLRGADLTGAQLESADASFAELQSANLTLAQLQGADLYKANLQGADLYQAKLQGAVLRGANLQGAALREAQLQGADLYKAKLQRAYLWGAQLQGTFLYRAKLQGAVLRGAQLQGADLEKAQLQGAKFGFARLQGANLKSADLQGVNLKYAELQGADLTRAEIWLARFPSDLPEQSPAPLGMADLKVSPWVAEFKAELSRDLRANITDRELLERLMESLDPILRDDPPVWEDEDRWRKYAAEAEEPTTDELAAFLAGMACDESEGHIAGGMARRAEGYVSVVDRRDLGKRLAERLLDEKCKGAKALTDEARARLKALIADTE